MRTAKPKSSIIYSGPSFIDGSPIVAIAIVNGSNRKTGSGMIQTYIIRSDLDPMTANRTGEDYSICGNCKHRGTVNPAKTTGTAQGRSCYVTLFQGPSSVYRTFKRGSYPVASLEETSHIGAGRMVRLGSYGDPLAVPAKVWETLLSEAVGSTGYTHQSRMLPQYAKQGNPLMVSADNLDDVTLAHKRGYRTFRVIPVKQWQAEKEDALHYSEVLCPASEEGKPKSGKVTCEQCKLCDGNLKNKRVSIAIVSHGPGKAYA